MRRPLRWALGAPAAALLAVFGTAGPAAAHVTVNGDATQGGYARLAFRVPTESSTAKTVKVEVFLPEGQPIKSVSVMPVPGWTAELKKQQLATPVKGENGDLTEAVTQITWTANTPDAQIATGQFQEFPVSLGPLPAVDQLTFKALQTYSDGNVVRWIEESTGGAKPAKPAPVLKVVAKDAAAPAAMTVAKTSDDRSDDGNSGLALGLAVAGLVAGLAGLGLGARALARTRATA